MAPGPLGFPVSLADPVRVRRADRIHGGRNCARSRVDTPGGRHGDRRRLPRRDRTPRRQEQGHRRRKPTARNYLARFRAELGRRQPRLHRRVANDVLACHGPLRPLGTAVPAKRRVQLHLGLRRHRRLLTAQSTAMLPPQVLRRCRNSPASTRPGEQTTARQPGSRRLMASAARIEPRTNPRQGLSRTTRSMTNRGCRPTPSQALVGRPADGPRPIRGQHAVGRCPVTQPSERITGRTPRDSCPPPSPPARTGEAPRMAARRRGPAAAVPVAAYQIRHQ
jgi:hypothetical protein